jgi:hypothetical protein
VPVGMSQNKTVSVFSASTEIVKQIKNLEIKGVKRIEPTVISSNLHKLIQKERRGKDWE